MFISLFSPPLSVYERVYTLLKFISVLPNGGIESLLSSS